jgi:hypothetical protein
MPNRATLLNQLPDPFSINPIINKLESVKGVGPQTDRTITRTIDDLSNLLDMSGRLEDLLKYIDKQENPIKQAQMTNLIEGIVNDMPTNEDLKEASDLLDLNIKMKDTVGIDDAINKIEEITTTSKDQEIQLTLVNEMLLEERMKGLKPEEEEKAGKEEQKEVSVEKPKKYFAEQQLYLQGLYSPVNKIEDTKKALKEYVNSVFRGLEAQRDLPQIRELQGNKQNFADFVLGEKARPYNNLSKEDYREIAYSLNDIIRNFGYGEPNPVGIGRGIQGGGIAPRIRSSQILPQDVDYNKGVKASGVKFVPIGRYLINKRQLDKDIIAIKRPAGSTISGLPSQRVSRKLGNVIRKVIGGGIPSFDDFNDLDDDEKSFLSKVAKETRIDEKLSIPTPKKNEEEKDINQFEILKGQILAGNDNPELVKKFKSVILKLSNKNLIPKGQVRELLLELAILGH